MTQATIHTTQIGEGHPLTVIAGPCVIESLDLCRAVAREAQVFCCGQGLTAGLEVLAAIKEEFGSCFVCHSTDRAKLRVSCPPVLN